MANTLFEEKGLRFRCEGCGACCTGAPGTIYTNDREVERIADHLGMDRESFIAEYLYPFRDSYSIREHEDGRCFFYDDECTIYRVRPSQCSTYPFWSGIVSSRAAWELEKESCRGMGKGELFSAEAIRAMMRSRR